VEGQPTLTKLGEDQTTQPSGTVRCVVRVQVPQGRKKTGGGGGGGERRRKAGPPTDAKQDEGKVLYHGKANPGVTPHNSHNDQPKKQRNTFAGGGGGGGGF